MSIVFDASSADTFSGAGVANLTSAAFTVAGLDRVLIGAIGTAAGSAPTTHSNMKWGGSGGAGLTQAGATLDCGNNGRLSLWRLITPAAASQTLFGDWAATQDESVIGATSYTGVDQITPLGTPVTNTGVANGGSQNMTVTITTVVGDLVWAAFWAVDANGNSPLLTPNGTPSGAGRYEVEGAQLVFEAMQIQEVVATGTSTVVSCQIAPTSGSLAATWGAIAVVITPVAAGSINPITINSRVIRPRLFAPGLGR